MMEAQEPFRTSGIRLAGMENFLMIGFFLRQQMFF